MVRAVATLRPFASYRAASSSNSAAGSSRSSWRSLCNSAFSVSRWVLTETYSPNAIDTAPATRPALPAVNTGARSTVAAATPTTMPAVETIPSLAPRTAARSQFNFDDTEPSCGSDGCGCGVLDTAATIYIKNPPD